MAKIKSAIIATKPLIKHFLSTLDKTGVTYIDYGTHIDICTNTRLKSLNGYVNIIYDDFSGSIFTTIGIPKIDHYIYRDGVKGYGLYTVDKSSEFWSNRRCFIEERKTMLKNDLEYIITQLI